MAEHCEHCDLPLAQCVHGRPAPREVLEATGPTIDANIPGSCPAACGQRITPGDSITHTMDGWAHTRCTDRAETTNLFEGI